MKQIRIFFDTNILVYAHDEDSFAHLDCVKLVQMALDNRIQGVIAEQNIIELYRVLTNSIAMKETPLTPQQTSQLIQEIYLSGAFEIVYPNLNAMTAEDILSCFE